MIIQDSLDTQGPIILDGNHVYRGIFKDKEEEALDIYKLCHDNNIFDKYIIGTQIARDKKIEGFHLVLEHERIDTLISPAEFSPLMFKDAGNIVLEFMLKLESLGLGLVDGHIYNVNFHKGKFLWIDFGSVSRQHDFKNAICEFISSFVNPIAIISGGGYKRIPALISHNEGVPFKEARAYLNFGRRLLYTANFIALKGLLRKNKLQRLGILLLKKWFNSYEIGTYSSRRMDHCASNERTEKALLRSLRGDISEKIINLVKRLNPERILFIGGDAVGCVDIMNRVGIKSAVVDADERIIDQLYERLRCSEYTYVAPAVMDIIFPTPLTPFENTHSAYSSNYQSSIERFKSDVVVSFGLIHRLVLLRQMNFFSILKQFKLFTKKILILEYIHPDSQCIANLNKDNCSWYSLENFKKEISRLYNIIDTIEDAESAKAAHKRSIIVCEVK